MRQLALLREKQFKHRKVRRAISIRQTNHVVLKARLPVLRRNATLVKRLIRETQIRFGMRIHALAIMPDHIHLVIRVGTREQFADSMRFLAGMVALRIGRGKLWRARVWSRVVRVGRDLRGVLSYVWRNPFEASVSSDVDCIIIHAGILAG